MDKINIRQLVDHETCTYTYVLWCANTYEAAIIDPVLEQVSRDLDYINKLKLNLKYIFETHVHADHITGASALRNKTNAKICYGSKAGVQGADILFKDNDEIKLGNFLIRVMHTPGHTRGCVSYYVDGFIFTGGASDWIFRNTEFSHRWIMRWFIPSEFGRNRDGLQT